MRLFVLAAAILIPLTSSFATTLPSTTTELVDTWGSVLYCQGIYKEPDVRGRIYAGDLQACDKSDRLLRWLAEANYSQSERKMLEQGTSRRAAAIRYNTRSVQDAVTACRQLCRGLSGLYDKMAENGEIAGSGD